MSYIISATSDAPGPRVVVSAELISHGWRMTVTHDGQITRTEDNGPEAAATMAMAVLNVMASELMA